mmetsp:Transcript_20553/g.61287  ORF Transcript_20553/g.61287 Transcript_20553/m.61287 type:complete len:178 (-) Transcript_20553:633-1166(-)
MFKRRDWRNLKGSHGGAGAGESSSDDSDSDAEERRARLRQTGGDTEGESSEEGSSGEEEEGSIEEEDRLSDEAIAAAAAAMVSPVPVVVAISSSGGISAATLYLASAQLSCPSLCSAMPSMRARAIALLTSCSARFTSRLIMFVDAKGCCSTFARYGARRKTPVRLSCFFKILTIAL